MSNHTEMPGEIKTKVGMPWCRGKFWFLSERISSGRAFQTVRGIKSKAMTILLTDLTKWVKLWYMMTVTKTNLPEGKGCDP